MSLQNNPQHFTCITYIPCSAHTQSTFLKSKYAVFFCLCRFLRDILVFIGYCLAACSVGTHDLSEHIATIFKVKLMLLQTHTKRNTQQIVLFHFWDILC